MIHTSLSNINTIRYNTIVSSLENDAQHSFFECPWKTLICWPDSTYHSLALPSSLLVRTLLPSLQQAWEAAPDGTFAVLGDITWKTRQCECEQCVRSVRASRRRCCKKKSSPCCHHSNKPKTNSEISFFDHVTGQTYELSAGEWKSGRVRGRRRSQNVKNTCAFAVP